jgi:hypothetical protein
METMTDVVTANLAIMASFQFNQAVHRVRVADIPSLAKPTTFNHLSINTDLVKSKPAKNWDSATAAVPAPQLAGASGIITYPLSKVIH